MINPKIQNDLFEILLRFRMYVYAFSENVERWQGKLDPNHTLYQRVFWHDEPRDKIKVLELLTVIYGTAPASYLAVRVRAS